MRRLIAAASVLVVGLTYLAGYWPQSQRRAVAEQEAGAVRSELAAERARVSVSRVLVALTGVTEAIDASNYGEAQARATVFFDAAQAEAARSPVEAFRAVATRILEGRDAVTAALARADPAARTALQQSQLQLRTAILAEAPVWPVP